MVGSLIRFRFLFLATPDKTPHCTFGVLQSRRRYSLGVMPVILRKAAENAEGV